MTEKFPIYTVVPDTTNVPKLVAKATWLVLCSIELAFKDLDDRYKERHHHFQGYTTSYLAFRPTLVKASASYLDLMYDPRQTRDEYRLKVDVPGWSRVTTDDYLLLEVERRLEGKRLDRVTFVRKNDWFKLLPNADRAKPQPVRMGRDYDQRRKRA